MGELQGESDDNNQPESHAGHVDRDAGAARQLMEPRTRAEYADDLKRQVLAEWARLPPRSQQEQDATDAPLSGTDRPDISFEALRRFNPRRAGLPEISNGEAAAHLDAHHAERPWLAPARGCAPEVQRIFAALDQGGGHAHIRHEGWVTEEMNKRRVAYLEDPAQLHPAKRAAGIDGLRSPEGPHRCREVSSRFTEPEAFAMAFARGIEHPMVRTSLDMDFTPGRVPRPVSLYVSDLLGPDGHRFCTGWRLQPVEGSMNVAREHRAAFVDARFHERDTEAPEPNVLPIGTFAGGTVVFAFGPTRVRNGYEIITMYPRPRRDEQLGGLR